MGDIRKKLDIEIFKMKIFGFISSALVFGAENEGDRKVPPRHPLQRLETLVRFSEEILTNWYGFLPSKDRWIAKFAKNGERMEKNFLRGNQRCGFYDADLLPHGG